MRSIIIITKITDLNRITQHFGVSYYKTGKDRCVVEVKSDFITITHDQDLAEHYTDSEALAIKSINSPNFFLIEFTNLALVLQGLKSLRNEKSTLLDDDHGFIGCIAEYLNAKSSARQSGGQ